MYSKTSGFAAGLCFVIAGVSANAATTTPPTSAAGAKATSADPHLVMGNESCVKCHAAEVKIWKQTPHSKTFEELHRRPEAKKIASNLGLKSIKSEGRCVACHYTQKAEDNGNPHVIAGVSCESCHGAAKDWLSLHSDYGGEGITRLTETSEHRQQRIAHSVAAGMRNPANVYLVAQSCLRCHTTADEELVNVGGHTAGSLEFEFVSWSQGLVRHNFVRSDGKTNEVSSPERLRVMFVAGMIAELEASMRATAIATQKATYGVTAAKRAARSGARIKSVAAKVNSPILNKVLEVFGSVTLKLNNADQLKTAADKIAVLGHEFAETNDGSDLSALDTFIPKADRYK
jgi:cytochrome c551/c552